ncbi:MAG: DUF6351 family protein [Microthrixaceae bacterium]
MAERLAATRPEEAVNKCFDLEGTVVESGPGVYEKPGPCTDDYPVGDDPRTAAGAPLANDVIKCSLQSVDEAIAAGEYEVEFSAAQVERLEAIFPEGVCDWSVPAWARFHWAIPGSASTDGGSHSGSDSISIPDGGDRRGYPSLRWSRARLGATRGGSLGIFG